MEGLFNAKYDVTVLTNWASDTFREAHVLFTFPLKAVWRDCFGRHLPDQAGPAHLESSRRLFGFDPRASLFIDGSQKNLNSAIDVG